MNRSEFAACCRQLWPELDALEPIAPLPIEENSRQIDRRESGNRPAKHLKADQHSEEFDHASRAHCKTVDQINRLFQRARELYQQLVQLLQSWKALERTQIRARDFSVGCDFGSWSDSSARHLKEASSISHLCDTRRRLECESSELIRALFCKGIEFEDSSWQPKIWRLVAKCNQITREILSMLAERELGAHRLLNYSGASAEISMGREVRTGDVRSGSISGEATRRATAQNTTPGTANLQISGQLLLGAGQIAR